jgi:hypothetical protein
LSIEVSGDRVSLTHSGVNMSGKYESGTTILEADGQEHPVSPEAPGVVVITRWGGLHALETEARKDGRIVGRGTYAVSEDGKTLTASVSGTDARGSAFEQEIVFDRG